MNCPKCGWSNPDDADKCANCFADLKAQGQPEPTQQMPQQPQPPQQFQQPQPPQQPYAQQPYSQPPYGQQPYAQQYAQGPAQSVPDHMVWSIVVTVISLLCCWCIPVPVAFGIVAIVKSSQASSKKAMGDYLGALRDANAAKTWLYWAVGLDIAGFIITLIFFFAGAFSGFKDYGHYGH